jgi:hypothetical protein
MPMSQLALFQDLPRPTAYAPKQEHVLNQLRSVHATLREAEVWPWEPVIVEAYRERTLPYLYALVADDAEAEEWRVKIEFEMARLEGSTDL